LSGITVPRTGKTIRDYLLSMKEGSPSDVYRELSKVKRTSYDSVCRYFWILKKLGLIQLVREAGRFMSVYRITPGMEDDPRWSAPQVALYPETMWGSYRYKKLRVHRDSPATPATNIRINRETREILRSIRVEGETYDDVLRRIAHEELKEMEGEDQEDEGRTKKL